MSKSGLPFNERICRTPLQELWNDDGIVEARKVDYVTTEHIRELLKKETVYFVLASAGHKLVWYKGRQSYDFWHQVKSHICNDKACSLDDFPGGYFYFAVEWRLAPSNQAVIVLEHHH